MTEAPTSVKENLIQAKDVIAWLRTQPKERRFNYFDNNNCLFASYAKAKLRRARERVHCLCTTLYVGGRRYTIPHRTEQTISNLSTSTRFTAAKALKALRAL